MDPTYERSVEVRYTDLDPLGHANNAVYATFCEQARTPFVRDVLGVEAGRGGIGMVIAHLEIDFERPVTFADEVTVGLAVTDVGGSSFELAYDLRDEEGTVATATTTQVAVDGDGRPRDLPEDWRPALEEHRG